MPQRNKKNFCPECGEKTANKLRKREERAKKSANGPGV